MKAAITQLRIHLDVLTTNEPINRAEGNTEQADLEAANAAEIRQAIAVLERTPLVVDRIQEVLKASPSSGPLWHGSTQISGLREALAVLERPSAPTVSQETSSPQTTAPEPLGGATCSVLISVLREVGARLKDGFDTRGVPCKVKPFLYGFEIQVSGVSLCIGGRGTVEKPDLCVSSCECDLDGNITGPLINPLELEIPVTSEQSSLDGLGSQRTMVGETLASGDGEQATDDTQIGVDDIDEVLSNHREFSAERPSGGTP